MKKARWLKPCTAYITSHKWTIPVIALVVILSVVVPLWLSHYGIFERTGRTTVITSSTLTQAIDIAELSTAEYNYRGIAEIYTDENRTRIQCRACYNAIVKAGIDMKKVVFDIDGANKTITATLPEIDLKVTIIDEQSMALLPADADVGIDRMLRYCREDAESEAKKSEELFSTARENLQSTIHGLLYPILKAKGYTLMWK